MNLEELETSLIRAAQSDIGPAPSDRERHHAELMARLQGAAPWSSGGPRLARGDSDPTGRLGLGSAVWSAPKTSGWSRFELVSVGLVVGVLLGGVLGFGLGRGWFGVNHVAAINPTASDVATSDVATSDVATSDVATSDPLGNLTRGPAVPGASGESGVGAVELPIGAPASDGVEPSADEQVTAAPVPVAARGAAQRERRVAVVTAPPVESSLAMELSMLQRARRALNADNGNLALGIVVELDERFPKGVLIEERNATRVLSLCMLHRFEEARRFGRLFLERHPASVYAERVRQSCVADPLE